MSDGLRETMKDLHPRGSLFWILVLAAALRVWGIAWGAPDAAHAWSYHPDEAKLFLALREFPFMRGTNAVNGCAYLVPYGIHSVFGAILGLFPLSLTPSVWTARPDALHNLYVWNRLLSVAIGLLSIVVLHRLASMFLARRGALAAAAILAILPDAVLTDHFLRPHSLNALCVLLYVLVLARMARGEPRAFLLGFMGIMAAAAEYPLAFMVPFGIGFVLWKRASISRHLAGLCAGIPLHLNLLVGVANFSRDAGALGDRYLKIFHLPLASLPDLFVPAVSATVLVAGIVGCAMLTRDRAFRAVLGFAAAYFLVYFAIGHGFARRFLPLYPLLCLGAAAMIDRVMLSSPLRCLLALALCAEPALRTAAILDAFSNADTRTVAAAWINDHVPEGSVIYNQNWFFAPHISMKRYCVVSNILGEIPSDTSAYVLTTERNDPSPEQLRAHGYVEALHIALPHRIGLLVFDDRTWPEDMRYVNPAISLFRPPLLQP